MVFVDLFRKPLILLTFLDFGLVDRVWFLRVVLWSCGFCCGFWIARSALRVRNGKSRQKPRAGASIQAKCASRARSALRARRLELRPRHPKNRKSPMMWFLGELVVFAGLVDLRSKVVIKGKPPKNLTPQSKSC